MFDLILNVNAIIIPHLSSIAFKIIVFSILIGVLISVHEFGHFFIAKLCGVGVIKFSLGFGPVIFRKTYGETIYQLCWIPLGGFVRLVGDIPDPITGDQPTDQIVRGTESESKESVTEDFPPAIQAMIDDRKRWFIEKNFWARTAIVFAGPLFNFLLAFVIYCFTAAIWGEASLKDLPIVGSVEANSPAALAGVKAEDLVLAINAKPINKWSDLAETIHKSGGIRLELLVKRGEQELQLHVEPQLGDIEDDLTRKSQSFYFIGIKRKDLLERKQIPLWYAPVSATIRTGYLTAQTYLGLWKMVSGQISAKNLAGPIFIFKEAGTQANKGLEYFLHFMAILSISLAVINLLPIPILDGGHILFFILEALLGHISMRKKEFAQQIGLFLILSLMIFVIYNDIENRSRREADIKWRQTTTSSQDLVTK